MTLAELIDAESLLMTVKPTERNPGMEGSEAMDHWRCRLARPDGRRMLVTFSMGRGHKGEPPSLADVLDTLASDAALIENTDSWEEFAGELGYNPDSMKAHRSYQQCVKQTERLKAFLGSRYPELLWEIERP